MINSIEHETVAAIVDMVEKGIMPQTQSEQSKIFGVQDSTYSQWVTSGNFPKYACIILRLRVDNFDLSDDNNNMTQLLSSTIPVEHNDKILLIKLKRQTNAVYHSPLSGDVIAECTEADQATYILDFIH